MVSLDQRVAHRHGLLTNNFLLLRIGAAALVIAGHALILAPVASSSKDLLRSWTGYVSSHILGVQIFFVISGFLVFGSLQKTPDLKRYIQSRLRRIVPGYWVCLFIMTFVLGPIHTRLGIMDYFSNEVTWRYLWSNASFWTFQDHLPGTLFSSGTRGTSINGSLWTIPMEVRLYLLVALLGVFGLISSRLKSNLGLMGLFAINALVASTFNLTEAEQTTLQLGAFFGLGALFFNNRSSIILDWRLAGSLIVVLVLLRPSAGFVYCCALSLPYFILCLAYGPKIPLPRWLEDYSYGMYLYGFPIQQEIALAYPDLSPATMIGVSLPLSLLAGAISWHVVEKRFLVKPPYAFEPQKIDSGPQHA